jgi:hypothetical protein
MRIFAMSSGVLRVTVIQALSALDGACRNEMGGVRLIFAALKNPILSDDQRKSEPLCVASLYR